ncbi:glycosyltransferase family 9 protein [bacterium]|nr:glycosyltransferase family 9 protein [bacterium]
MTTPAVKALRNQFPDAFLSYVVENPYKQLVEGNPAIDHIWAIPPNQEARDFIHTIHEVQKEKYDAVIDFHGGPRASLITFLSMAKLKIGYNIKYKNFIYNYKIPREPEKGHYHSVENHFNLVKLLGIPDSSPPPLQLPQPKKKEIQTVDRFLNENHVTHSPKIVLHIGAGNQFRSWGEKNLCTLIQLFSKLPQVHVILVGSQEDRSLEEKIFQKSSSKFHTAVGQLNLRELQELISRASLFVGPDSGPMHIAAATSTPIVAYFGPTLPANFSPWRKNTAILEKDLDCRPCRQKQCIHQDYRCLRRIKPEQVYKACLSFLQGKR